MSLTFLLGGARSGKSRRAMELASRAGGDVTFIATGEARDDEMTQRIVRHRTERPEEWDTIEAPLDLAGALSSAAPENIVVVDCLSLWVANQLEHGASDDSVDVRSGETIAIARARQPATIVVSNEVGLGVVPPSPLGRRYRDLLGRVNAQWAEAADEAVFVVAGRLLQLR